ncbi:MAG: protoporphyrinogen oxidase HemJ [Spongiibacteraceae bacterium]|nr:protoporphyrinogen oxidase HemJ [Spongiibacteraceae bacterium]
MPMLWIKALHIIFVVCWFAGLFYLPRLMVYHASSADPATRDTLLVMERRLYRFTTPFAVLSIGLGLWLAVDQWAYYRQAPWFHAKLGLVALLVVYHGYCGRLLAALRRGETPRSPRFYRVINELPVLILFAVVILVVVRPF